MIQNLQAIILAAGKSSRFKTGKTKLLEKICGQEMILYPVRLLQQMNIPITLVVGFQKELIKDTLAERFSSETISFVEQEYQQGTGHAIVCSRQHWHNDHLLIINGDIPLIDEALIQELYTQHCATKAAISFVVSHNADPLLGGYGRVIKENNQIEIVEAKNFHGDTNEHCCINAGIYIVEKNFLVATIDALKKNEVSTEFYFTDIVKIASDNGYTVTTVSAPFDRIRGVNTLQELWIAEQIKRGELIKYWMEEGVHFSVAQNVHIDLDVTIGAGSKIGSGVHLRGKTTIGNNCEIHEFSSIDTSSLGDNSTIYPHSIVKNSVVGSGTKLGPFAHIHTQTHLGDHCIIGNFVEIKKSTLKDHTKAKHLSYLGDAHIGNYVNIGAGTIICNHNGVTKNTTSIQDNAYIGSNNTLVAPLTVGAQAFTAAGSVITEDVPAQALAIGRSRQTNKEGYAQKLLAQKNSVPESTLENTHALPVSSTCQTDAQN